MAGGAARCGGRALRKCLVFADSFFFYMFSRLLEELLGKNTSRKHWEKGLERS